MSRELADSSGPRENFDLEVPAPPFDYNPGAWSQRVPIAILAAVGTLIAAYLALYQWRLVDSVWDPVFGEGTERVLDSEASHAMRRWMRIPDAALGAIGYLSEVVYSLVGSTRRWQYRPWMVVIFGIDVIPLGLVSAILVVIQGVSIGSWCFLCLVTAAISLLLVYFAYDEVWACLKYLYRVRQSTGSWRIFWRAFWGVASPEANRVALEPTGRSR